MGITVYNSLMRRKEELIPLEKGKFSMYVCGPTVYDEPHIGHARSAYVFDLIRRYLIWRGYEVKFVRNVTDVDDKIIDKARNEYPEEELQISFKKVADKYLESYHCALDKLGIAYKEPQVIEPKASQYIPKMITFIEELLKRKVAYVSNGDVYFDISQAKSYGKLSNQSLEKMEAGARVALNEQKRNPLDFALWKKAKKEEPCWDSPWGKGRPGWHIECSVMSSDILGDAFDIHGGGIDLIFPHHENEIAQSEAAGKSFARYWLHHGLLTINGQKMAKSLGNFITVEDFLRRYKYASILKLFFLSTHYSHPIDYTETKISEAKQALERISILWHKINTLKIQKVFSHFDNHLLDNLRQEFVAAMDDDFNTPKAVACLFELISQTNKNILDKMFVAQAQILFSDFLKVLGIDINEVVTVTSYKETNQDEENKRIEELIQRRLQAKRQRNFLEADRIRKELEQEGIILEDTKEGTTWRRKL
ncbi:MAG: cysteine--tRNA ligase [Candidatus Omnitrophica bacterium]|nr:cysteine--tRNA ligase [Candidatus Omnitrophota bacterium]